MESKTSGKYKKKERVDFLISCEKCEVEQSKFSFRGIKIYETNFKNPIFVLKYDERETIIDKPGYLRFIVLEFSKLHRYELYYDMLQPYHGEKN